MCSEVVWEILRPFDLDSYRIVEMHFDHQTGGQEFQGLDVSSDDEWEQQVHDLKVHCINNGFCNTVQKAKLTR